MLQGVHVLLSFVVRCRYDPEGKYTDDLSAFVLQAWHAAKHDPEGKFTDDLSAFTDDNVAVQEFMFYCTYCMLQARP